MTDSTVSIEWAERRGRRSIRDEQVIADAVSSMTYPQRCTIIDAVWLSAFMASYVPAIAMGMPHAADDTANAATESIAEYLDEVTRD
ncbi:hypothetical protein A5N78_06460 [Prescottella equi]|uniref:hypothetical protein n=1 Tax=Rhodococcus hoagii TaxID=43767 RepID=UPI000A1016DE|nr:hypothetical protein [Prescottella equi]ORL90882.1 hypothetical protein A5N78_06460 [Prescottella equi]ORM22770.1 hypothetical protein A5N70_00925 [Prescottella equi]